MRPARLANCRGWTVRPRSIDRLGRDPGAQRGRFSAADGGDQRVLRYVPGAARRSARSPGLGCIGPSSDPPPDPALSGGKAMRELWHMVVAAMTSWHQAKLFVEHA